jgi:hypothetical protein
MAGRAGAYTATIVVKVHIRFLRNFEDGLVYEIADDLFGGDAFIFKLKNNFCHRMGRQGAKACFNIVKSEG